MNIDLNNTRIIVVEDDFVLATSICRELQSNGATVLGPAPTPYYALQLLGPPDRRRIDAAVLDIRLHGTTVFEVAETLQERGVPFILATAYERHAIPGRFADVPFMQKPISPSTLASAVGRLVRKQRPTPAPAPVELPPKNIVEVPAIVFARAIGRMLGQYPVSSKTTEPSPEAKLEGQCKHETIG